LVVAAAPPPFDAPPLARGLAGAALDHERLFGGPALSKVYVATLQQFAEDLARTREELAQERKESRECRAQLQLASVENGVLKERVAGLVSARTFGNVANGVGVFVILLGADLLKDGKGGTGWACVVLGAVLVCAGWLVGKGAGK
jgi:hypothetical protein